MSTIKERVILDIPKDAIEDLHNMMQTLDIKTKTELVRYSLAVFATIVKAKKSGAEIYIKRGDDVANLVMPILGL